MSCIRDVPDFPKPGIVFKDITPLLLEPRAFDAAVRAARRLRAAARRRADRRGRGARLHLRRRAGARARRRVRPGAQAGQAPARDDQRAVRARVRRSTTLELHADALTRRHARADPRRRARHGRDGEGEDRSRRAARRPRRRLRVRGRAGVPERRGSYSPATTCTRWSATSASTCSPWRSTNVGPTPLIAASSSSVDGLQRRDRLERAVVRDGVGGLAVAGARAPLLQRVEQRLVGGARPGATVCAFGAWRARGVERLRVGQPERARDRRRRSSARSARPGASRRSGRAARGAGTAPSGDDERLDRAVGAPAAVARDLADRRDPAEVGLAAERHLHAARRAPARARTARRARRCRGRRARGPRAGCRSRPRRRPPRRSSRRT